MLNTPRYNLDISLTPGRSWAGSLEQQYQNNYLHQTGDVESNQLESGSLSWNSNHLQTSNLGGESSSYTKRVTPIPFQTPQLGDSSMTPDDDDEMPEPHPITPPYLFRDNCIQADNSGDKNNIFLGQPSVTRDEDYWSDACWTDEESSGRYL